MGWFRGNLHTHTTNSDGDSDPDVVVAWYRDAGYDFLVITDHDFITLPSDYASIAGRMLLVTGEEVTAGSIHVNGLGIRELVDPRLAMSGAARDTLQENVNAVREAGGVPTVNHPNFRWQLRPEDLLALRGCALFEVHNAGPETNGLGRPGHPSHEELWDLVLSAGKRFFGVAVDDAHHFRSWGRPYSNPGRAWVMVESDGLDETAILDAIDSGRFYASTGVAIHAIAASRERAGARHRAALGPRLSDDVHRGRGPRPRRRRRGRATIPARGCAIGLCPRPRRGFRRPARVGPAGLPGLAAVRPQPRST